MNDSLNATSAAVPDPRPPAPVLGTAYFALGAIWTSRNEWLWFPGLIRTNEADARRDCKQHFELHQAQNVRLITIDGTDRVGELVATCRDLLALLDRAGNQDAELRTWRPGQSWIIGKDMRDAFALIEAARAVVKKHGGES